MLVTMKYDYGDPKRGESYEYFNFYDSLKRMGHDVLLFDYMSEMQQTDRLEMNRGLLETIKAFGPNVAIFSLYTDQILPQTVLDVRKLTKTLCFFHDDTWRREFSMFWARHFDFFTSSDFECKTRYKRLGLDHIIHFPFGCNEALYKPYNVQKKYDVSFVGGWHPYREWIIKRLRRANIKVEVAGHRWPRGLLRHEDMVRFFSESKINLNLSNSASWDARYLLSSPFAMVNRLKTSKDVEQLKARHFEINGCRAFQLSYYVDGLERCYELGREIAIYRDPDDLVEKVRFFLANDDLREEIAEAGYRRTIDEHTYQRRFEKIFAIMGVSQSSGEAD